MRKVLENIFLMKGIINMINVRIYDSNNKQIHSIIYKNFSTCNINQVNYALIRAFRYAKARFGNLPVNYAILNYADTKDLYLVGANNG